MNDDGLPPIDTNDDLPPPGTDTSPRSAPHEQPIPEEVPVPFLETIQEAIRMPPDATIPSDAVRADVVGEVFEAAVEVVYEAVVEDDSTH